MIDVLDISLKSKFNSTGVRPLTGSIGSYIEVTIDFIVHWEAINFDCTLFENQIISNDGTNFIDKGFKVGDTIVLVYDELSSGSNSNEGTFLVTGISSGILYVTYSDSTSGTFAFTTEIGSTYSVYGTTPVTAIDYYFGLIENSSGAVYTSLIDGETQQFRATGLDADASGTTTLTPQTLNKSWLTGTTTEQALNVIEEAGIGTSGSSTGYEQRFVITHVFHISPAILNDWENSSEELSQALVSWFNLSNCLKYVPRIVAGFVTSGTDHTTDNGNLSTFLQNGDTGFYDEFRNGGTANFELDTISYDSGARDEISKNVNTDVEIVINKTSAGNFDADFRFDLYVFQLPEDTADFSNNTSDVWTNFTVSNVYLTPSAGAIANSLITGATVGVSGTVATINFTYTAPNNDNKYIIFCDIGDTTITSTAESDHMAVLCDYRQFELFIDTTDIITFDNGLVNEHSTNDLTLASTDYKGWVEDGLKTTLSTGQIAKFGLKKLVGVSNEWTCTLNSVVVSVTVEHATDSTRNFTLESLSLSNPENTTRGYVLNSTDEKNTLSFNELTADANYRYYALEYATKLQWMEWVTLTTDPDFTSSNANWSNYDLPPDWQMYINVVITADLVNGSDTEQYERTHKIELNIKNYDEYESCEKTAEINTYTTSGGSLLQQISTLGNTMVIASFYGESLFPCIYDDITSGSGECEFVELLSGSGSYSNGEGNLATCPDYYGILEIDRPNGNTTTIDAISTIVEPSASTVWIGEMAVNKAKLIAYPYASPPRIDVIATLDLTLLTMTYPYYKLSARLGKYAQTICDISIMTQVASGTTLFSSPALVGFNLLDLLVWNLGLELSVISDVSIASDTLTFSPSIGRIIKVCCSKDAETGVTDGVGTVIFPSLIGASIDDFILFAGSNGAEGTTKSTTVFNSGTGEISVIPALQPVKISHHVALFTDSVSGALSYYNALLVGLTPQEIMLFVNGIEQTSKGCSLSAGTFTFSSSVTGLLKVCLVNQ